MKEIFLNIMPNIMAGKLEKRAAFDWLKTLGGRLATPMQKKFNRLQYDPEEVWDILPENYNVSYGAAAGKNRNAANATFTFPDAEGQFNIDQLRTMVDPNTGKIRFPAKAQANPTQDPDFVNNQILQQQEAAQQAALKAQQQADLQNQVNAQLQNSRMMPPQQSPQPNNNMNHLGLGIGAAGLAYGMGSRGNSSQQQPPNIYKL